MKNIIKLLKIAIIFARNNIMIPKLPLFARILLLLFKRKNNLRKGENLANIFCELGAPFIKLGQILSTRADIIGEEMASDLIFLQDNVPPSELDLPDIFDEIDQYPIATASISQVYFAKINDKKIAVKILRPNIDSEFQNAINLMRWTVKILGKKITPRLKIDDVIDILEESTNFELDLRYEAAAMDEMRENLNPGDNIYIPIVYWKYVTKNMLVSERINGININDKNSLIKAGHNPNELAKYIATHFFLSALRDGFFHADMHAGNIFITFDEQKNSQITLLDFGIMGRIDKKTSLYFALIIKGFLEENYLAAAKAHFSAGYVRKDKSIKQFAQACRAIGSPIFNRPLEEISLSDLLGQLFQVTETFGMELQPHLLLLQKTMVMVEGIGRNLSPSVNIWKLAEEPLKIWAENNLTKSAFIKREIEEILEIINEFIANKKL